MRRMLVIGAAVLTGCSPDTGPTPTPTPSPEVTVSVHGRTWDAIGRAVAGARIEIITGRLAGTFVIADDNGLYAFAVPVPVFSEIKASKAGYLDAIDIVTTTRIPLIFRLGSTTPPVILAGQFDVTFEADAECTAIPDVARKRTYLATSISATTTLSGAVFAGGDPPADTILLSQFGEYARFSMSETPIWEVIPNAGFLMIFGEAVGVLDPSFSQLEMDGEFRYCSTHLPSMQCTVEMVSCKAPRHVMTLKRR